MKCFVLIPKCKGVIVKSSGMPNIQDFTIADATCSQSQITIIMILDTQIPDWTLFCNSQVLHNLCEISWDVKHLGFHNCRCNLQPVSNYHHHETGHPNPRLNTFKLSSSTKSKSLHLHQVPWASWVDAFWLFFSLIAWIKSFFLPGF
jgi:hypothetical protein